jgi:hypothetical protein
MASTDQATALSMRAAEARRSAEAADDEACRQTLLSLDDTYERIAERKRLVDKHAALIEARVAELRQPVAALR